jgi:hypothetical protein
MTLTEFLLARIAEDEADWSVVASRDVVQMLHGKPLAPRMLAECEAKRRIVEHLGWIVDNEGRNIVERNVLRLLALPYADHPDYREEWRP